MNKKEGTETKNVRFEEALKRLEKIVERLEAGDVPLDESLSLYEEGIALFRGCSSKLEEAKKKVEILTKKGSGKLSPEPFEPGRSADDFSASVSAAPEAAEDKEELPF